MNIHPQFILLLALSTLIWSVIALAAMLLFQRTNAAIRRWTGIVLQLGAAAMMLIVSQGWIRQHRVPASAIMEKAINATSNATQSTTVNSKPMEPEPVSAEVVVASESSSVWMVPDTWSVWIRRAGWLWMGGTAWMLALLFGQATRLGMVRRRARLLPIRGGLPVFESAQCATPCCSGLMRPFVLMPLGMTSQLEPDELRGLLAHEEAHVRQGDVWLGWMQSLLCASLWWNPLIRMLAQWTNSACEELCDLSGAVSAADRSVYIRGLLKVARMSSARPVRLAPAASGDFLRIRARLERLLLDEPSPSMSWTSRLLLGVPLLTLACWLAIIFPMPGLAAENDAPVLVMLDPGHGGPDVGAQHAKLLEKDIVLQFSKLLQKALGGIGVKVVLTRESDVFVSKDARLAKVNASAAGLFLALHAGSEGGRSPQTGLKVGAHEATFGAAFLEALKSETRIPSAASQAKLSIVDSVKCPALLLEIGSLSDEADVGRLSDPKQMAEAASAVARAVSRLLPKLRTAGTAPKTLQGSPSVTGFADGFDFPVGAPDAAQWQVTKRHLENGHPGEDWKVDDKTSSAPTLGASVQAVADGTVVMSEDARMGFGNVIIVQHRYRSEVDRSEKVCESFYSELQKRLVSVGQMVKRGQQIGEVGTNDGMYSAHLHFEMRKTPGIGLNRTAHAKDDSNYLDPSSFIKRHRPAGMSAFTAMSPRGTTDTVPLNDPNPALIVIYEFNRPADTSKPTKHRLLRIESVESWKLIPERQQIEMTLNAADVAVLQESMQKQDAYSITTGDGRVAIVSMPLKACFVGNRLTLGGQDSPTALIADYVRERLGAKPEAKQTTRTNQ